MSQAEELLDSTTENSVTTYTATPATEGHITIDTDRTVYVPDELKNIAVQFDHNIETVAFDCPRYWDEHDLSTMQVFINYMRPDRKIGQYLCTDVTVDTTDTSIMHFTWTISGNVTEAKGAISFLVCVKAAEEDGTLKNRWSSRLNQEMTILEGMNASGGIVNMEPDVITAILSRLDELETNGDTSSDTVTSSGVNLKLNVTLPFGRAKGDTSGTGAIASADAEYILNVYAGNIDSPTDAIDIWAADVNNDDAIDSKDWTLVSGYIDGTGIAAYSVYAADYYGNWSWDTIDYCYYYDIPVSGVTETYSAILIVKNSVSGATITAKCLTDVIRVCATCIPTSVITCDIVYSVSGSSANIIRTYDLDTSLSVSGKAADAKAVGDILGNITALLDEINGEVV